MWKIFPHPYPVELCYGPAEIKGAVVFAEDYAPLMDLKQKRSAFITGTRSLKSEAPEKTRTVVIKDETHEIPFYCKDREG